MSSMNKFMCATSECEGYATTKCFTPDCVNTNLLRCVKSDHNIQIISDKCEGCECYDIDNEDSDSDSVEYSNKFMCTTSECEGYATTKCFTPDCVNTNLLRCIKSNHNIQIISDKCEGCECYDIDNEDSDIDCVEYSNKYIDYLREHEME
jgi:hypothetical protein